MGKWLVCPSRDSQARYGGGLENHWSLTSGVRISLSAPSYPSGTPHGEEVRPRHSNSFHYGFRWSYCRISIDSVSSFVEDLRNPQRSWCLRWRSRPDLEPCRHLHIVVLLRSLLQAAKGLRDLLHRDRVLHAGVMLLGRSRARMAHNHAHHRYRDLGVDESLTVGASALAEIHIYTGLVRYLLSVESDGVGY